MGNLALSIVAVAVLVGGYLSIQNKDIKAKNVLIQTKSALNYEKYIKKENSTSYAKLNVKPSMLFITNNVNEKILLNKLSNAIKILIKKNPNRNNFTCKELASTDKISYSECERIYNKKFTAIIPTNTAVENEIENNIGALKNKVTDKIVLSAVTDEISPNIKTKKELAHLVATEDIKTIQNPVAKEVKIEKVIKKIRKYHIENIAKIANNTKVYKVMNNIMKVAHNTMPDKHITQVHTFELSQIKDFIPNANMFITNNNNPNRFNKFIPFSKNNDKDLKDNKRNFNNFDFDFKPF